MVFIRHLFEALINPFFLIVVLGCLVFFIRNKKRPAQLGSVVLLVAFVFISTGFLPKYITERLEQQYFPITNVNDELKLVVVLGGGQLQFADELSHNRLTSASIRRLLEGVRLYRQLANAKLILSGGGYKSKHSEAELLSHLSIFLGVPEKDIILEQHSINTADQAAALKKLIGTQPFYLVTSAIHMPRAMALCQTQGLSPIAAPTDFTYYWYDERWQKNYIPNPNNLVYLNIAWHELLGSMWGILIGQIKH